MIALPKKEKGVVAISFFFPGTLSQTRRHLHIFILKLLLPMYVLGGAVFIYLFWLVVLHWFCAHFDLWIIASTRRRRYDDRSTPHCDSRRRRAATIPLDSVYIDDVFGEYVDNERWITGLNGCTSIDCSCVHIW